MRRSLLFVLLTTGMLLPGTSPAGALALPPCAPSSDLFLVPDSVAPTIGGGTLVHDYGNAVLVHLPDAGCLPARVSSRLHAVPELASISFRSWRAELSEPVPGKVGVLPKGYYALALAGPVDATWRQALQRIGLRVVASGFPFVLVVKADGVSLTAALRLTTSEGFRLVRGLLPLPAEARLSRELLELVAGKGDGDPDPVEVRMWTFEEQALAPLLRRTGLSKNADGHLVLPAGELTALVREHAEIAYLEPVYSIGLHNNLAARSHLIDAESVWSDLGYNGSGVIISHNDTGVDLDHPDLPFEAFVAVNGRMSRTNNGHGTHTAGSIIGRGVAAGSPLNTSGCGDRVTPLPSVRGIAWGARLATNNMFEGGLEEVDRMLWWGAQKGATISSNSWGFAGELDWVGSYAAASVAVDIAVRDADTTDQELQPMAVFFSAGNIGPTPGTVTSPGNAKNAITVGASHNDRCGSYIPANDPGPDIDTVLRASSRGPAQDRIKPDIVAPGSDVLSTQSSDELAVLSWDQEWTGERYALEPGTSMSCALAAGAGAVFQEFYWSTFAALPSPALIKAAFINSAVDLGLGFPSHDQGWGRLDLHRAVAGPPNGRITFIDQDSDTALGTGQTWQHDLEVFSAVEPLRVTLVWTDVPGEEDAGHPLVNDLDLQLSAPDGTVYRGNRFSGSWSTADPGSATDTVNNVENVFIQQPASGTWAVRVTAANVTAAPAGSGGQDFALVYSGDAADCVAPPPPSGVSASGNGDNRIDISWEAAAGAAEYAVFRALQPGGRPYLPVGTVAASGTSFSDTDVSGGITYYYVVRVRSADNDCWSTFSAETSASTTGSCHLPPRFAGLDAVRDIEQVSCTLELSWSPAEVPCGGEPTYTVFRGGEPGVVIASGLTGTNFLDTGLVHGEQYLYVVQAVDPDNGLADGNTLVRSGSPSGPDTVFLENRVESGEQGWHSQPGSAADPGSEPWQVVIDQVHSPVHSWFCADADGIKDQALVMPEPLLVPAGVPVVLEHWHRYILEERFDGGRLEYSVDGGASWYDMLEGNGYSVPANPDRFLAGGYTARLSDRSYSPIGGAMAWSGSSLGWGLVRVDLRDFAGQLLLLRWRLACDAGTALDSGWWVDDIRVVISAACQTCLAPDAPAQVSATPEVGGVRVSWAAVAGAGQYQVLRTASAGRPHELLATVAPPATSYLDDEVSGGTTYSYTLRVRAGGCWSELSQPASAEAPGPCSLAPVFYGITGVATARESSCSLDLSWQPAQGRCDGSQLSYRVYRSRQAGLEASPATLLATGVTGSSYRDTAVISGERYNYLVRAMDDGNGMDDGNLKVLTGAPGGPILTVMEDDMEQGTGWWQTATGAADRGTTPWTLVSTGGHSGEHFWFCVNEGQIKDQMLVLARPIDIPDISTTVLEVWHRFQLESLWDGGRLEYSVDGGGSWHDILEGDGGLIPANPERFLSGGYNGLLSNLPATNPLAGSRAWTGGSGGWTQVRVSLADFRSTSLLLRWRLGCDVARYAVGWWIDDLRITYAIPCTIPPRATGGRRAP